MERPSNWELCGARTAALVAVLAVATPFVFFPTYISYTPTTVFGYTCEGAGVISDVGRICVSYNSFYVAKDPNVYSWPRCPSYDESGCICGSACMISSCLYRASEGRMGWDYVAGDFPPAVTLIDDGMLNVSRPDFWSRVSGASFSEFCGSSKGEGQVALRFRGASQRVLQTHPVDMTHGGVWRFKLIYGTGTLGCAPMQLGLVHLAASLDGGTNWTSLAVFDRDAYMKPPGEYVFTEVVVPREFWAPSVMFKFYQPLYFDLYDTWALDRVTLGAYLPPGWSTSASPGWDTWKAAVLSSRRVSDCCIGCNECVKPADVASDAVCAARPGRSPDPVRLASVADGFLFLAGAIGFFGVSLSIFMSCWRTAAAVAFFCCIGPYLRKKKAKAAAAAATARAERKAAAKAARRASVAAIAAAETKQRRASALLPDVSRLLLGEHAKLVDSTVVAPQLQVRQIEDRIEDGSVDPGISPVATVAVAAQPQPQSQSSAGTPEPQQQTPASSQPTTRPSSRQVAAVAPAAAAPSAAPAATAAAEVHPSPTADGDEPAATAPHSPSSPRRRGCCGGFWGRLSAWFTAYFGGGNSLEAAAAALEAERLKKQQKAAPPLPPPPPLPAPAANEDDAPVVVPDLSSIAVRHQGEGVVEERWLDRDESATRNLRFISQYARADGFLNTTKDLQLTRGSDMDPRLFDWQDRRIEDEADELAKEAAIRDATATERAKRGAASPGLPGAAASPLRLTDGSSASTSSPAAPPAPSAGRRRSLVLSVPAAEAAGVADSMRTPAPSSKGGNYTTPAPVPRSAMSPANQVALEAMLRSPPGYANAILQVETERTLQQVRAQEAEAAQEKASPGQAARERARKAKLARQLSRQRRLEAAEAAKKREASRENLEAEGAEVVRGVLRFAARVLPLAVSRTLSKWLLPEDAAKAQAKQAEEAAAAAAAAAKAAVDEQQTDDAGAAAAAEQALGAEQSGGGQPSSAEQAKDAKDKQLAVAAVPATGGGSSASSAASDSSSSEDEDEDEPEELSPEELPDAYKRDFKPWYYPFAVGGYGVAVGTAIVVAIVLALQELTDGLDLPLRLPLGLIHLDLSYAWVTVAAFLTDVRFALLVWTEVFGGDPLHQPVVRVVIPHATTRQDYRDWLQTARLEFRHGVSGSAVKVPLNNIRSTSYAPPNEPFYLWLMYIAISMPFGALAVQAGTSAFGPRTALAVLALVRALAGPNVLMHLAFLCWELITTQLGCKPLAARKRMAASVCGFRSRRTACMAVTALSPLLLIASAVFIALVAIGDDAEARILQQIVPVLAPSLFALSVLVPLVGGACVGAFHNLPLFAHVSLTNWDQGVHIYFTLPRASEYSRHFPVLSFLSCGGRGRVLIPGILAGRLTPLLDMLGKTLGLMPRAEQHFHVDAHPEQEAVALLYGFSHVDKLKSMLRQHALLRRMLRQQKDLTATVSKEQREKEAAAKREKASSQRKKQEEEADSDFDSEEEAEEMAAKTAAGDTAEVAKRSVQLAKSVSKIAPQPSAPKALDIVLPPVVGRRGSVPHTGGYYSGQDEPGMFNLHAPTALQKLYALLTRKKKTETTAGILQLGRLGGAGAGGMPGFPGPSSDSAGASEPAPAAPAPDVRDAFSMTAAGAAVHMGVVLAPDEKDPIGAIVAAHVALSGGAPAKDRETERRDTERKAAMRAYRAIHGPAPARVAWNAQHGGAVAARNHSAASPGGGGGADGDDDGSEMESEEEEAARRELADIPSTATLRLQHPLYAMPITVEAGALKSMERSLKAFDPSAVSALKAAVH